MSLELQFNNISGVPGLGVYGIGNPRISLKSLLRVESQLCVNHCMCAKSLFLVLDKLPIIQDVELKLFTVRVFFDLM